MASSTTRRFGDRFFVGFGASTIGAASPSAMIRWRFFQRCANKKCVSWAELAEWLVNVSRSKVWNPDRSQYPQVHCFLATVNVATSSESRHFQFDLQLLNLLMRILREDVSYCLVCSNAVGRYSEALHSDTLLLVFLLLLFGTGHSWVLNK